MSDLFDNAVRQIARSPALCELLALLVNGPVTTDKVYRKIDASKTACNARIHRLRVLGIIHTGRVPDLSKPNDLTQGTKQAKVYRQIVQRFMAGKPTTATKLRMAAKLPRRSVHATVSRLVVKGYVYPDGTLILTEAGRQVAAALAERGKLPEAA